MNFRLAQVIVDVPSRETDRPFDYSIPKSMQGWIEVGSRVGVPFGHRTVQGFVVSLKKDSEMDSARIKPIAELLDLVPPLSPDLVELAEWMSRKYACSMISSLQAMIPAALKGKAERYISVAEQEKESYGDSADSLFVMQPLLTGEEEEIVTYVKASGSVTLDHLNTRFPGQAGIIKGLISQGVLSEVQLIKDKVRKKMVKTVAATVSGNEAEAALSSFTAQARRQKEVLQFLLEVGMPLSLQEVLSTLRVTAGTVKKLEEKGYAVIEEVEVFRDPYQNRRFKGTEPLQRTPEQDVVYSRISAALDDRTFGTFLLHGVTGSGKTEVYLQTIERCISSERQAIVLVPEISLTPQMVERFKGRFGSKVALLHSRLSHGERYDEWRKIREGKVQVAIGARSAIFAPFRNLGLIVMDEEHETSYKQEETPKYHARDVAVHRARQHGAVVILGSATPSLESYYAARSQVDDKFAPVLLEMKQRPSGSHLPAVHIVDMREELRDGNRSMFSRALHAGIASRLERGEQTVLFLNRRGYSTFVMCRTCGYVAGCPDCDISLTYHQKSNNLRCHYCGYATPAPSVCPECGSEHIRYFGTGTQRVEGELAKLFPGIRVVRMDVDTTSEKGAHEKLLKAFREKKGDVLLGTQMVAKGLDFPDVTLVGVIAADTALNLPDFRAAEKTFQLLTQVAGRAGRHQLPGEVFIQTYMPEHYSVVHASGHDYDSFVREELKYRKGLHYPPYSKLILVTLSHEKLPLLLRMAENFAGDIRLKAQRLGWYGNLDRFSSEALDIMGPVASPIPRIKNRYRFQCMVKYRGSMDVVGLVREIALTTHHNLRDSSLQISIDVDPQMLM
ncbi:replication restart DNA helicase PriA [Fontibacillus panacisegetis]|uniref:Replication restart protein PriA n=1 Tax=Fontibacillus panacisegetis TaxID=670482 RepID=A0A1G7I4N4_9BACL|nr:primosomal protein N' [Fontibacillus panacisegetis]SDF07680.1 replication restart DNA helicase PriA [Fontibacillus panacisegetis]